MGKEQGLDGTRTRIGRVKNKDWTGQEQGLDGTRTGIGRDKNKDWMGKEQGLGRRNVWIGWGTGNRKDLIGSE